MFRKLRLKFISIAASSVLLVLIIVLGSVNLITYNNTVSEIFTTLDFISKHSDAVLKEDEIAAIKDKEITPETQYETRYITVMVNNKGKLVNYDAEHIAAIDEAEMEEFVNFAINSNKDRGLYVYDNLSYAFLKTKIKENTKITVMDCTRNISTANFFVRFSIYTGILSMLLVVLILLVFARRVVEPYVKNAEAQKQFITNASHELKTPLAVISANTEVIEMINGKSEWTESTVKQVGRMSELISQLVVLSRLEERQDMVLVDVDMSEEVNSVLTSFKSIGETEEISFSSEVQSDVHVQADQKGLRELVNILVDNAVKYCDENGTVSVSLTKKGKNACLVVSNDYSQGDGVDYKRFFDRFYREDQSHNSEKKGYGIGLSMAESLVRMFKGKISVAYKKPVISFTVII
ncbi:MAG: HAMP domain-containing histidine kinase [Eubacterium sp.]|nr:HAMP domain-containing histidine kinase [Eubacterium sp.]